MTLEERAAKMVHDLEWDEKLIEATDQRAYLLAHLRAVADEARAEERVKVDVAIEMLDAEAEKEQSRGMSASAAWILSVRDVLIKGAANGPAAQRCSDPERLERIREFVEKSKQIHEPPRLTTSSVEWLLREIDSLTQGAKP